MGYNQLSSIQNYYFNGLKNLIYLDLNFNQIANIESDAFNDLINLQTLYLSNNNIKKIAFNIFKNSFKLTSLYFNYNSLEDLGDFVFQKTKLAQLELKYNNLSAIKKTYFSNQVTSLKYRRICSTPTANKGELTNID